MPCNDCLWSQRALSCLQAPSAPAEEPLKEPISQDLDVSHAVVDASYRRVKLLHVRQCMDCTCMYYQTTCSQGKLISNGLSTPSVAACSIHHIDVMPFDLHLMHVINATAANVICHCRSTPWAAQREEDASTSTVVQVLMVSESNVCRSVLAEIIMRQQLTDAGLDSMVQVESKVGQ